jgi:CxxC motif-containing protein (DUF1111 family)
LSAAYCRAICPVNSGFSLNNGSRPRFGWKAQNKSLQIFAGEAYNVEMDVTNEPFPSERGAVPVSCQLNPTPEDGTNFDQSRATMVSDIVAFSAFMRFLAPPAPSAQGIPGNPSATSVQNGQTLFSKQHASSGSEANAVVSMFNLLSDDERQDLLNFLRSL